MVKHDVVRHNFRRYLTQTGGSCSTHSFLGVLAELVESETGVKTEFDYEGEYEKIHVKGTPEGLPIYKIAKIAETKGFRTLDGRLVKITGAERMGKYPTWEAQASALYRKIQMYGPGAMTVRWNYRKGTSLVKHKDGILTSIKQYVRNWNNPDNNRAHGIALVGFDRDEGTLNLANSWGEKNSDRRVKAKDLYKMYSNITFIKGFVVFKK